MTPRELEEYRVLRDTIRGRGTARVWLFWAGTAVWAAVLTAIVALSLPPAATFVSLVVLAATFEGVLALHVAVERIGRYLLVFFDDRWEETAGRFGRPRGAIGLDPLFTWLFATAAVVNLLGLLTTTPIAQEIAAAAIGHGVFLVRLVSARAAAARQRAVDAARFEELKGRS